MIKENEFNAIRKESRKRHAFTKSQCLDIVEAAKRDSIYPLIFCHIEFENKIDIELLKKAIERSTLYVPEILYAYDFSHGRFIDKGFTTSDTIIENKKFNQDWNWDLGKDTQLKVLLNTEKNKISAVIGISHILCDGNGFKQYLYLLAALYNKSYVPHNLKNKRSIAPYLDGIKIQKATEKTKFNHKKVQGSFDFTKGGDTPFCIYESINETDFRLLKEKVHIYHITLNDVFLTAYARVIAKLKSIDTVCIPCPADLRNFQKIREPLTIANLTGMYRQIQIEVKSDYTFIDIATHVHTQMLLQKSKCRCFLGISKFNAISSKIPFCLSAMLCKMNYHIMPISYTNIGIINDQKLYFSNCKIRTCFFTGSYRYSPDFQLSISTYKNICILSCNILGDDERKLKCEQILKLIKREIISWINE